ncbi:helix-turn-helix domain-containing protein [Cellulomonas sp. P24]|uniref:helix-turn-helix domain-containing protein n=1 Tax=Cellulomonas sp. P24 TaxID=2885206 RepID=UPI0028706E3D|nr:helix-turn-helix domain-containing protein [Cellulomonas sp. P24]
MVGARPRGVTGACRPGDSFTMVAAFGELERDMIHERTMAGLAASRRQGRIGGRPSVMDDEVAAARARRAACQSHTQIAKALGISRATAYRHLGATGAPSEERFTGVAPSAPVKHPGLDVLLDLDRGAGARLEVVLLRVRARPGVRRCRRSRRGCV